LINPNQFLVIKKEFNVHPISNILVHANNKLDIIKNGVTLLPSIIYLVLTIDLLCVYCQRTKETSYIKLKTN